MLARDNGPGHSENIIASAAYSLQRHKNDDSDDDDNKKLSYR